MLRGDRVKDAVHPIADPHVPLRRFDMDVRRPFGDRLGDEEVHHLDDGALLDGRRAELLEVQVLLDGHRCLRGHLLDGLVGPAVLSDRLLDVGGGRHDGLHFHTGDGPDVVQGEEVARVRHGDHQLRVLVPDRDRAVAAGDGLRDECAGRSVDHVVAEVDEVEAYLARQRAHEVDLSDHPELDEHPSEELSGLGPALDGAFEVGRGDEPGFDEDLPELFRLLRRDPQSGRRRCLHPRLPLGPGLGLALPFAVQPGELPRQGESVHVLVRLRPGAGGPSPILLGAGAPTVESPCEGSSPLSSSTRARTTLTSSVTEPGSSCSRRSRINPGSDVGAATAMAPSARPSRVVSRHTRMSGNPMTMPAVKASKSTDMALGELRPYAGAP
jgi:hypothetical protein